MHGRGSLDEFVECLNRNGLLDHFDVVRQYKKLR